MHTIELSLVTILMHYARTNFNNVRQWSGRCQGITCSLFAGPGDWCQSALKTWLTTKLWLLMPWFSMSTGHHWVRFCFKNRLIVVLPKSSGISVVINHVSQYLCTLNIFLWKQSSYIRTTEHLWPSFFCFCLCGNTSYRKLSQNHEAASFVRFPIILLIFNINRCQIAEGMTHNPKSMSRCFETSWDARQDAVLVVEWRHWGYCPISKRMTWISKNILPSLSVIGFPQICRFSGALIKVGVRTKISFFFFISISTFHRISSAEIFFQVTPRPIVIMWAADS